MNNRNKSVLIALGIILVFVIATIIVVFVSGDDDKNKTNGTEEKESYVDMTADLQEVITEKLNSLYYLVDGFGATDEFDTLLTNQQKLALGVDYTQEVMTSSQVFENLQRAFGLDMSLIDEDLVCDFGDYVHFKYDEITNSYINMINSGNTPHVHGLPVSMNAYSIESIIYETKSKEYTVKALTLFAKDCSDVCGPVEQYYKDAAFTLPIGATNASAESIFISKKAELEPITFTFKEVHGSYALIGVEI